MIQDMSEALEQSRKDPSNLDPVAKLKYQRGKAHNPELFEYFESLDENPALILAQQGHAIETQLGKDKGHNRIVLKTHYEDGLIKQERIVKIPLQESDKKSVNTQRQRATWQTNTRETRISNMVGNHPNISRAIGAIRTPTGQVLTVEQYQQGVIDLEERVQKSPLSKREFVDFATTLIETNYHLNVRLGILHKDLKPDNILISREGTKKVLITDLDNAQPLMDADPSLLPTRGASQYTHPRLLEAPIKQQPVNATLQTETYSVGATLFYTLTGTAPFDYTLRKDGEGVEIEVAGKVQRVALFDGTEKVESIDPLAHDKKLKQQLKKVPRRFRKVLYRSMTLSEDAYESISDLKKEFEQATTGNRVANALRKAAMPVALVLALTKIGYDNIDPGDFVDLQQSNPVASSNNGKELTKEEFMRAENLTYYPIKWNSQENEKNLRNYILFQAYKDLDEHLPDLLKQNAFSNHAVDKPNSAQIVLIAKELAQKQSWETTPGLDVDIGIAWLVGSYLSDKDKMHQEFQGRRDTGPGYAPLSLRYLAHPADQVLIASNQASTSQNLRRGKRHLCNLLQANDGDVEQAFIQFYFEREAIIHAQEESASQEFLPVLRVDGSVLPGYVTALQQSYPERTRTLLNTLAALNAVRIEYDDQWEHAYYSRPRSIWAEQDILEGNSPQIEAMLGRKK